MDDQALSGVRAIVARNDALARENLGILLSGLQAQQARNRSLGSSGRWFAIAQLFEDEARKLIRTTSEDVRRLDTDAAAFEIIETTFREFVAMVEAEYFDLGSKAAPFGGSRPIRDQDGNPFALHWNKAKDRLGLEVEASRADFRPASEGRPAPRDSSHRNAGGKPLAKHWDAMWADIAVQLWTGDLQPLSQADVKRAMQRWFDDHEIDVGDTALVDRARQLWQRMEAAK
jgi:hypothetical protein